MHIACNQKITASFFLWLPCSAIFAFTLISFAKQAPAQSEDQPAVQSSLDEAVETYNSEVQAALDSLCEDVKRQLEAAMKRGDLEAAQKLSLAEKQIRESGKPSPDVALKPAVDVARRKIVRAGDKLSSHYEVVAKALLKSGDLSGAETLLTEKADLLADMRDWRNSQPRQRPLPAGPARAAGGGGRHGFKSFRLVAMKSGPEGWEAYYREIQLFDAATGRPLTGGKASASHPAGDLQQQTINAENAFDGDQETKYRTGMNPGVNHDWIGYELPEPARVNRVTITQLNPGAGGGNHVFWIELLGSNDGEKWQPIMRAQSLPGNFDSSAAGAQVQWLR